MPKLSVYMELDVFEVTPTSIEGDLPDWLSSIYLVNRRPIHHVDWECLFSHNSVRHGNWGDYLVLFPDPVNIQVLSPEQLEDLPEGCPFEKAARVAEQCQEASRPVTNEVANRIACRIRSLKQGGAHNG